VTDLLLDTDAISILFKPAHPLYQEAYEITVGNHLVISFMTLAELSVWPIRNNWGVERRTLLKNFLTLYTPLFPDETTCQHWADISAESLDAGRPMGTADTWIAACARQWGMALVTGNYKDFEHISGMTLVPLGS
jgi:predicted nucleic acid-binding protein